MSGPNPTLTKNFTAETAVTKYRIVKLGSSDGQVAHATAATDAMIGVVAELDAAAGERVDVHLAGLAEVEFGGTVTRGALVTADAQGRAVAAAPLAGVNNRVLGVAMVSAVSGDIASVLIAPQQIQG